MALLNIEPDAAALARAAAARIGSLLEASLAARGAARLCLTGGGTPREIYRLLGHPGGVLARRVDWSRVHCFWGDERHVAPEHPESNYRMARETLLDAVSIPSEHIHRIRGELPDAHAAAQEYERTLRGLTVETGTRFDVMLLGLGADAHIASIFPGSPLLTPDAVEHDSPALAAAVWAPHLQAWRITLTPAALVDAARILVITAGPGKAGAVHAALERGDDVARWPAQILRTAGDRVEWWMDAAAGSGIQRW